MRKVYVIGRDPVPSLLRLGAGERAEICIVFMPGSGPMKFTLEVDLDGEGASFDATGVWALGDGDDVAMDVLVRHNASGCVSRQSFKGVAGGTAKVSFEGLVYVARNSQKTLAKQECHCLLLSEGARAQLRPQLEIYADDVECSHGATTGYLNPDEQFYMRSRGIPEDEARRLQVISFLSSVLEDVPEEVRDGILAAI